MENIAQPLVTRIFFTRYQVISKVFRVNRHRATAQLLSLEKKWLMQPIGSSLLTSAAVNIDCHAYFDYHDGVYKGEHVAAYNIEALRRCVFLKLTVR